MRRPVDAAMAAERPEKHTVRGLWVEVVREADQRFPNAKPLYLTLPGAEGRDLALLAEQGIFDRTEVGGIAAEHFERLVAVESRPEAVIELLKRFPGLQVRKQPIQDLVHGTSPTAWPDGDSAKFCRARVINLDLNAPLAAKSESGQLIFPILTCIAKLSQLHATAPQLDWILCLTLHGLLPWTPGEWDSVSDFLAENCAAEPRFAEGCRDLLGEELYRQIIEPPRADVASLDGEAQQKLLMAFVPKRIAHLVVNQGWHVLTIRNLRYGGVGGAAPMVTWVIEFRWDQRASTTPQAVYRESLGTVFIGRGRIAQDGIIS